KIEILDSDEAYAWMQVWLAGRLRTTLTVSVLTRRDTALDGAEGYAGEDYLPTLGNRPNIYFVPAVGTYFFWYRGRFVTLNRDRQENATTPSPLGQRGGDIPHLERHNE